MKKCFFLPLVLLSFFYIIAAETGMQEKSSNDSIVIKNTADQDSADKIPLLKLGMKYPLTLGEKLIFKIRYGFINAGTAVMSILEETEVSGYATLHIQTTARSASGFSWIYKVEDVVSSYVRIPDFFPIRFEKKLREGSYFADQFADFFPEDSLVVVENIRYDDDMKIKRTEKKDIKAPPFIHDVLSAFYVVRTIDLKVGEPVYIKTIEKYKVYDLKVIVHKKETIKVEAGKFRCIVIEPLLKEGGIFKNKGKLKIWLTDDDLKIPVQMKTEVVVGSLTTELMKIEGIHKKIKAKIE